jgi:hypothetical protein
MGFNVGVEPVEKKNSPIAKRYECNRGEQSLIDYLIIPCVLWSQVWVV